MFGPPAYQCVIVGSLMAYFPIHFRNVVVYPTVVYPHQYIGIEVVVVLQTIGGASVRVTLLVAVNAEGANTELYPRLALAHGFVYFFDEHIHIISTPIAFVGISTAVLSETGIIGKVFARIGVGVEIIVHVDGIDIIAVYDVAYNLADVLAVFGKGRVEVQLVGISHKLLRLFVIKLHLRFAVHCMLVLTVLRE